MTDKVSEESVRSANWSGSIPIVLSLAPSSLSSPTMPTSIHVLMARQSYLHIGLKDAVKRLHKFAPTVLSISTTSIVRKEPKPGEETDESGTLTPSRTETRGADSEFPMRVCWFEDEESQIALRWHLFAGVLWDMRRKPKNLPWKLRLHFSQYPASQILPMDGDVMTVLERSYKHSLKQALFLQKGSSKVGMGITKQSFEQVWDSILTVNCKLYQQVDDELQGLSNLLPVRLLIDSKPPIQRPLKVEDGVLLGGLLADWAPSLFQNTENGPEVASTVTQWSIQGLQIPLSAVLKDLWQSLSHPDHFLYVVV
eukprot:CAMPEP_0119011606 /NCGR_PEP_ID=MMETSP1176-20130426/5783_1 /TAXON_ID=265551 /ORGANISM="Synedropsis recta cf, Strain CCMP1620" /LENGTH=310 /DNA_ID=CAMNT_0006964461 /DNA_START=27 /DNA_END=956 /DNA_ORIENTATION=+